MSDTKTKTLASFILNKISNFTRFLGSILFLNMIICVYGLMYFANDIPDYSSLQNYNPPTITRLYTNDAELLTEYASEPRIFTKVSDMPKLLINAFIAAEDKTFFENYGIDPMGIVRSVVKSIGKLSSGKRVAGASTITQQVVQSFIVGKKRTLDRKISEMILAYRISQKLSKEKILELYLNQIFLGNNSYGVTQAAKTYFNKNLSELDIAEVAMLASLPKAPSSFSPYTNPERLLERRNWVIQRMYEEGMINQDESIEYIKTNLGVVPKIFSQTHNDSLFYTEEVKKELIQFYGEDAVYKNGLTVHTNLNQEIQKAATEALRYGIEAYDKRRGWRGAIGKISLESWQKNLQEFHESFIQKNGVLIENMQIAVVLNIKNKDVEIGVVNGNRVRIKVPEWIMRSKAKIQSGQIVVISDVESKNPQLTQIPLVNGAMVVIENYTGRVLGIVGGYNPSSSYFNRAIQAKRQPGSAFKTFIYLAALENGFSKDSILMDEPISISQGSGMPNWRPQNLTHEFNGAVTMQEAFSRSLNIPAIQVGLALGLNKVYDVSSRLGLYPKQKNANLSCKEDEISKQYCTNYSLLLGAYETSLMNLTAAYATIASEGYEIKPTLLSSIYDNHGEILFQNNMMQNNGVLQIFSNKIIKTNANRKMIEMLKNAVSQQSRILNITVAGKTGTTNDSYDTWFIGSSRDFTVGVFIGYDLPKSLGKNEIGATVARPVFMHFMQKIGKQLENGDIGYGRKGIEMININDALNENEESDEVEDIDTIAEILKKKPEISIELQNSCPDCDDAFSVKKYQSEE